MWAWSPRSRLHVRRTTGVEPRSSTGGFAIEFILELVFDVALEFLVEFSWESVAHSVRRREAANPFIAAVGYALIGSVIGVVSLSVIPRRLLPTGGVRGASLAISPLVTGMLMRAYGEARRRRDLATTSLATFWGGATFAFFMALVRFLAYGTG